MPVKDRTGIKYGKLTAISYVGNSKWLCKCDCGNEKIVYGGHLESGHTKTCGCIRPPRKNLIGQIFGKLTPKEWLGNSKWLCQCECGNFTEVLTYNLLNGNTKSCGCYQKAQTSNASFKDLTKQRFGKLTVLKREENNIHNHVCYKCQCDCGNIIVVDANNLRAGTTSSCGCLKSKGEYIIGQILQSYNILYQTQYIIKNITYTKTHRHPHFDFAIFNDKNNLVCLIEYDGKQHFQATGGWNTEEYWQNIVEKDLEKEQQCKKNNIKLYHIKYNENIDERLSEILKSCNLI